MQKFNLFIVALFLAVFMGCTTICRVTQEKNRVSEVYNNFCRTKVGDLREHLFSVNWDDQGSELVLRGEVDDQRLKSLFISELHSRGVEVIDQIRVLPDSVVGAACWGLVNLSVANLRSGARHSAEMGTQALLGTPVKVLDRKGSWYRVQTPDRYIAWVDAAGISTKTQEEMDRWRGSSRIIITADYGYVFSNPKQQVRVSDLVMGDILEVKMAISDGWKVVFPDGRTGFVRKECAEDFAHWSKNTHPTAQRVISLGKSFMGRPYLWGGTSTKAMDCSGFVKTIYFNNGIILARDASLQTKHGGLVETSNNWKQLQPGDLVFFGKPASKGTHESVTHVGMYIGDSEFIHCAGKVKINSFDSTRDNYSNYRSISLIRGRRVLSSPDVEGIIKIAHDCWYFQR